MGGPWRDRTFDAAAWRAPAPRREAAPAPSAEAPRDWPVGAIVLAYVASVVTSLAVLVGLLRAGW